jgi:antitoxin component of MazEF toxin-antitoxin module
MQIQTKLKKWGNSLGVVIPIEFLKKRNLTEGQEVIIEIEKKDLLSDLFGSLKKWKADSQKIKDEIREEDD